MRQKLSPLLYGLGVFAVYALLTLALRYAFKITPTDVVFLDVYSTKDLLIGVAVSVALTVSHERKKRM